MKHLRPQRLSILILFALSATMSSAVAQQIILKTGQTVETLGLRREGDMIMGKIQVGTSSGEIGYPISAIAKIAFPEPRGLKGASELLSQGQPEKALAEIDQVVTYYAPYKEVPGAWWAQAALVKVSILGALQRDADAEPLVAEIQKVIVDPETLRGAQLRLVAGMIRKQDFDKALQVCDAAIKESADSNVLADAWTSKGHILFAQKQWAPSLMAYLHVPVFYYEEKLFMPAALLGAARAYRRLDDFERAKKSIAELNAAFPKSPEATLAKAELDKMRR